MVTNNIPYNLYINFEAMSFFFKEQATRNKKFLVCGFASVELSFHLLGSFVQRPESVNADKVLDLIHGIETQLQLINSCSGLTEADGFKDRYSESLDNLKLLDHHHAEAIDRISSLYFEISKSVKIGFETQFNDIRSHFGLPTLRVEATGLSGQEEIPDIVSMLKLRELGYHNSEDELFMVTHQISECWFNIGIHELRSIADLFQERGISSQQMDTHFKAVFKILIYLGEHIHLLEHMVLADYHPLRVALRGASGGQSLQAHEIFRASKNAFVQFMVLLKGKGKDIVHVLERPKENSEWIAIVNHFSRLERSLKNFFFQHFVLSSSVIGSQSFGSIGYDLVSLVDRFVEPIFKEIDQAKYDLTLKTNFQYGNSAGILIMEKEVSNLQNEHNHTQDVEVIHRVINHYFSAISRFDNEAWIELFATNGYIEDPVGSRPYYGHQQLGIFFKGVLRFFSKLSMTIESKRLEERSTKVLWKAVATSYNGKELNFSGEEEFQINDDGLILAARVHWDPSLVAEQLEARPQSRGNDISALNHELETTADIPVKMDKV